MCWFEWGVSTSLGAPAPAPGLGLLPGSLSVHCDGEPARLPVLRDAVRAGRVPPGYAADDGVGLLFRGHQLVEAVSSRQRAQALRVDADGELSVATRRLSARERFGPAPDVAEYRRLRIASARWES
jgi:hypothetical protein